MLCRAYGKTGVQVQQMSWPMLGHVFIYLSVCPADELADAEGSAFRTVQTTIGAPVSLKCSDSDSLDRSRGSPCWVREDTAGGQAAVTSRGHRSVNRGQRSEVR